MPHDHQPTTQRLPGGSAARARPRTRFGATRRRFAPGLDPERTCDESLGAALLLYGCCAARRRGRARPKTRPLRHLARLVLSFAATPTRTAPPPPAPPARAANPTGVSCGAPASASSAAPPMRFSQMPLKLSATPGLSQDQTAGALTSVLQGRSRVPLCRSPKGSAVRRWLPHDGRALPVKAREDKYF
jgi:hypothetical protein